MPEETIYDSALARFGIQAQVRKAVEELTEAAVELLHYLDGRGNDDLVAEELADVEIMLEQMRLVFPTLPLWKERKLARLEERLR